MAKTTIQISDKMREEIEKRKIHPRQTNEEIVEQALSLSGSNVVKLKENIKT